MTHQLEELPKNVQKLMCLYETENKYDGMYDIICASPFTPEEKATAIIQLIAQHETELLNKLKTGVEGLWDKYGEPPLIDGHEVLDLITSLRPAEQYQPQPVNTYRQYQHRPKEKGEGA